MSNRLYVGNLSFQTTEESLQSTFAACGEVREATIVTDRETGRSRGFGFVAMVDAAAAEKAISELNGANLDGRALRVNVAEQRRK